MGAEGALLCPAQCDARGVTQLGCDASVELEHVLAGLRDCKRTCRAGRGARNDIDDYQAFVEEDQVKRKTNVLHGDGVLRQVVERQQQPGVGRELTAKHQPVSTCGRCRGDFNLQYH